MISATAGEAAEKTKELGQKIQATAGEAAVKTKELGQKI